MGEKSKPKVSHKRILRFTWEEREAIVEDYLRSGLSKREIWKKYTGHSDDHGQILRWMRKLGYESYPVLKGGRAKTKMQNSNQEEQSRKERFERIQLEHRISELEKELAEAKMKAIAYSTMIDMAEEAFEIKIRKKFNTKPSKK